jgi:hypothetical protein
MKTRKCAVCTKPFTPAKRGVNTCDEECGAIWQRSLAIKSEKRILKAVKETLKKRPYYVKQLQDEINRLVRLIDTGHPCISSGNITGQFHAGHYYSVGGNDTIRFHLMNIYAQTSEQNRFKSGNPIGYREGLCNTFGAEHLDYVDSLKGHPTVNLSIIELKEKITVTRQLIREFDLFLCPLDNSMRLEYRRKFNERLGIYKY